MRTADSQGLVRPMQVRMEPENYQWLRKAAAEQDRSVNYLVNKAVEDARRANEAHQPKEPA